MYLYIHGCNENLSHTSIFTDISYEGIYINIAYIYINSELFYQNMQRENNFWKKKKKKKKKWQGQ
jgi:hypothetical protein